LPITITIQPGDYRLLSPITITPELSNLRIKGEGNSQVILKGSTILKLNWTKYTGNIYSASVKNQPDFDQLVANGKMQVLARYPNYNEAGGHWQGHAADAISKERVGSWKHPVGAIVHAMHKSEWGDFHYAISEIDANGNPVLKGGHQNNRQSDPHKTFRMVENVFEELDSPGEWFLDEEKQILYYWPEAGTDMDHSVLEGVILKNLITIKGTEEKPVRNVSIDGIRFEHASRTFMESYEPLLRSDWCIYRGGALLIEGAENCSLKHCELTNLGGNAIFVSGYNRNIQISCNHIHECGANAICFVGDPSAVRSPSFEYHQFVPFQEMDTVRGPVGNLYPAKCEANDNLIYRIGRIEKQTAGVEIAMAANIQVSHNTIYEVPRAGINVGDGTWGGHIIEFNDVFNTVLETSDHGAFNSWGRDRFWHPNRKTMDSLVAVHPELILKDAIHTTIIRNNRFRCDHGWDIDLDDGSSNYYIADNLCLNGGLKLREGFCRTAENNILINNGFHPHVWFNDSKDIFRRNIVSTGHKDIRLKSWGTEVDFNLFPDELSLEKARTNGVDQNSLSGDPLFSDAGNGNFSVRNDSPALKLGFRNFAMDRFGVQDSALKKIAAKPDIPALMTITGDLQYRSPVVNWLGAHLKNVETMAERSAAGLSETSGIIVLDVDNNSPAFRSGLQKGDVIIRAEGETTDEVSHLMKVFQQKKQTGKLSVVLFRNQAEKPLTISF
jgi:hypothetical protein